MKIGIAIGTTNNIAVTTTLSTGNTITGPLRSSGLINITSRSATRDTETFRSQNESSSKSIGNGVTIIPVKTGSADKLV